MQTTRRRLAASPVISALTSAELGFPTVSASVQHVEEPQFLRLRLTRERFGISGRLPLFGRHELSLLSRSSFNNQSLPCRIGKMRHRFPPFGVFRVRGFSLDRMREVVGSQVIFQAVLRDRDSEVRNR